MAFTDAASRRPARDDLVFMADSVAAASEATSSGATRFLLIVTALLMAFFGWASMARLDEVTRGEGQVIPSSKKQVVQSLEGGIVKALHVREGDKVESGQVLLQIDDTNFSSNLGELTSKSLALRTQVTRLDAEVAGKPLAFADELQEKAPGLVSNEQRLFEIRASNLAAQIGVLDERLLQKKQELRELGENRDRYKRSLDIAREEQRIKAPMARAGVVPKTDKLQIDRVVSDLEGQLAATELAIPRVEAAIREAGRLAEEQRLAFVRDAQKESNDRRAELLVIEQTLKAARDRVVRTDVRSPVDGIVNKLSVNTVGGVVRAGEPLVEVTPIEDNLLVQAKVRPQDIAFIRPGQKALVKITAYDFSIYGGLDGKVALISSDSTYDEQSKEPYYVVTVRTEGMTLKKAGVELPIIPGMVASVDVITGEKTVLDYILKPINKARYEALRER